MLVRDVRFLNFVIFSSGMESEEEELCKFCGSKLSSSGSRFFSLLGFPFRLIGVFDLFVFRLARGVRFLSFVIFSSGM